METLLCVLHITSGEAQQQTKMDGYCLPQANTFAASHFCIMTVISVACEVTLFHFIEPGTVIAKNRADRKQFRVLHHLFV